MKSRVKAVSTLLVCCAGVIARARGDTAFECICRTGVTDRAQFVADVTVPDGTRYDPGATFTKTWRLKNIGTCTWTTSYTLVFDSGDADGCHGFGGNFPSSVPPGPDC